MADASIDAPLTDTATDGNRPPVFECLELPAVDLSRRAPYEVAGDPTEIDGAESLSRMPESVPVDSERFPTGVQSGEMTSGSALLWTHYAGSTPSELRLWVWRPSTNPGDILLVQEREVTSISAGQFIHERVEGLAPATAYFYAFFATNGSGESIGRSPIGRVRTAPASGTPLSMTAASTTCVGTSNEERRLSRTPYVALESMATPPADMVLHLGDILYNDRMVSLDEYRANWQRNLSDPGYQALLASAGMFATWDDHEITDNFNPETVDPARFAAARQTFFEHLAARPGPDGRIWTSHRWGDNVEVFILDARSERRPSTRDTENPIFISQAQLDWLKRGLRESDAHFKVVMTSVNMANLPGIAGWDAPLGYDDRWEGYGAQREELLDHIVENEIRNVWFLAGDIHVGFVGKLELEGPYATMWEITVGPGSSNPNPLGLLWEGGLDPRIFRCDQFAFGHGRTEVTTRLEFDPIADAVHVVFQDATSGEVMFDEWLQQGPISP